MDFLRALILGVIQALTEFLPISSSAHLILFRDWLGFDSVDGLTFDVAVHVGTVLALIVFFHRDVRAMASGFLRSLRMSPRRWSLGERLPWYIVLGTIPAGIAGVLLDDIIETAFRRPDVIAVTLVLGGIAFIWIERVAKQTKVLGDVTLAISLLVGFAQSIALIPGVSRSGITMIAGMSQQLKRAEAARFSFLLSIPIMLGAGTMKALDIRGQALSTEQLAVLAVGAASSAVVGWLVIKFLLRYLQSNTLHIFAYYRWVLAIAILFWLLAR